MTGWILIIGFYVLALVLFRFAGGLGSAGEAFRRWGQASSVLRTRHGSSS